MPQTQAKKPPPPPPPQPSLAAPIGTNPGLDLDSQITELSEDQIEAIKEVFNLFDADGANTITIAELGIAMRELGQNPTEKELAAIIAEIDADGNGIIEFPEFVDLMSRRPWGMLGSVGELNDAFSVFKSDETNYVSAAEVRHALSHMGEKLSDEQIDEMFQMLLIDGDGRFDFSEATKLMMEK